MKETKKITDMKSTVGWQECIPTTTKQHKKFNNELNHWLNKEAPQPENLPRISEPTSKPKPYLFTVLHPSEIS